MRKKCGIGWAVALIGFLGAGSLSAQGAGRGRGLTVIDFLLQPKYLSMLILGILGLIILKQRWLRPSLKVVMMSLAVFFFGIAGNLSLPFFAKYAMHPSPICSVAKAILYGFAKPMIATAAVIFFLTLLGPKLFCGWVCPVGAIQELTAMLADKLKIRRTRVSFRLSNSVRVLVFLAFVFLSATAVIHTSNSDGEPVALSLYDWFNAFHGFEFEWFASVTQVLIHYMPLLLAILVGLVVYRPYCQFICPIGLVTHWLEPVAFLRINRKVGACNDCQVCIPMTPCQAVPEILKATPVRPDCFACGECLKNCHRDAFSVSAGAGSRANPE